MMDISEWSLHFAPPMATRLVNKQRPGCHASISSVQQVYMVKSLTVAAALVGHVCDEFRISAFELLKDPFVLSPQYVPTEPSVAPSKMLGILAD